ncbi:hypothetical protein ACFE6N_22925 [Pedobacter sp. BG31]|uniref:hypothetical protein n=1 Tax=Pedobacter sp. BG31 TaxID=3349697 RepID=UPI0035F3BFE7
MKINAKKLLIVAFLGSVAISLFACRKEIKNFMAAESFPSSVKWAKSYFYDDLVKIKGNALNLSIYNTKLLSTTAKRKQNYKIPIWEKAVSGKNSIYDFVEIPLKYTRKMTPQIYRKIDGKTNIITPNENYLKATLDRFIIYKDKNNRINQRIVTYIPTKEYLARHKGDISHNHINKLDKDFDGYLIYRTWDDRYLFTLIIDKGKAIKRILLTNPDEVNFRNANYRGQDCEDFDIYQWFTDCEYVGDDPSPVYCSEPYPEYVTTVTVCVPTGDDDESPNGGCLDPQNFDSALCQDAGIENFSKDECLERGKINSRMNNNKNKSRAAIVKTEGITNEYGFAMNLSNWSVSDDIYKDTPVFSDYNPDFIEIPFTWNSQNGYTIGAWHNHPANGSLSPDDIFWMMDNLSNNDLISAGSASINYYRANVSVGVQTATYNYTATVNSWQALKQLYDIYNSDKDAFRDAWLQVATEYQTDHPGASWAEATAYATKNLFGTAINLFSTDVNSNNYQPQQAPNNSKLITKICPN